MDQQKAQWIDYRRTLKVEKGLQPLIAASNGLVPIIAMTRFRL